MARFVRVLRSRMLPRGQRPSYESLAARERARTEPPPAAPRRGRSSQGQEEPPFTWRDAPTKMLEGSATALGTILVFALAGYSYHEYYKYLTLEKMENAFAIGYSSLEKAALARHTTSPSAESDEAHEGWIARDEQEVMDDIVNGTTQGNYWLITGEKGTGKTSMIFHSMQKVRGEGIAMLEVHGDLEIFRVRLGKALDYEYHEDYIGSLFSFKGPRDSTPLLDVERAFNKMEKIALKRKKEVGKPLILILNGVHLLRDDKDGRNLLELVQQRAEVWAASKLVTVILNSNDYWITERLMRQATRLRVMPIHDISKASAIEGIKRTREVRFQEQVPQETLEHVYSRIGGRLRFLSQVVKAPNMIEACNAIYEQEKRWLLNHCWILGEEMDPAAEEHQDFCVAAMVLAKVLVEKQKAMEEEGTPGWILPQIPLHEARQIMTRSDFIQHHDHISIFAINSQNMVQADSVPMQNVFKEICNQEGFEDHLKATMDRLDELESLGRTREVTIKDLWNQKGYQAIVEDEGMGLGRLKVSLKAVSEKNHD